LHQVSGGDALSAWQEAANYLLSITGKKTTNLFVRIDDAGVIKPSWLIDHNPASVVASADGIKNVSNWIFPERTWSLINSQGGGRDDLYARYPLIFERAKRIGPNAARNRGAWGSYFQRLIDFGPDHVNQLENAIRCLGGWGGGHKGAITFHLSSPALDNFRKIGGPCWHFGELSCRAGGYVDFTVAYRSHDYFGRALGNYIGLCRLLKFICDQTGKLPGQLICHSVYAWYDVSNENLRRLIRP